MNTPIERLRQRHVAAGFPDNQCCVVLSCGLTWPCDTVAALDALEAELDGVGQAYGGEARHADALQARLDAATVLLSHYCGPEVEFTAFGNDARAWLAGDKEAGNE